MLQLRSCSLEEQWGRAQTSVWRSCVVSSEKKVLLNRTYFIYATHLSVPVHTHTSQVTTYRQIIVPVTPFSSNRQHLSYDDCLEVRGEIIRTVLCCIVCWKLCTVIITLRWAVLTVLWIGFCLTGPISLYIDSCVYVFFALYCLTAYVLYYCNTVAWTW